MDVVSQQAKIYHEKHYRKIVKNSTKILKVNTINIRENQI